MRTVRLSHTDLVVSRLCMGTAQYGLTIPQKQVDAQLDLFLEHGGNFVDTAHVYSNWETGERNRSEKAIGRWLKRRRRSDLILCTKGGHFDFDAPDVSRVTPEQLTMDLAESLDCLQTDYIDLYMLHRDNPSLPVSEIMDCLDGFVRSGHVRYLACSNWTAARTAEANQYANAHGKTPFVVNELLWSMAQPNREALPRDYVVMDEEMMQLGLHTELNFMCFTSLAKGYFTRRFAGRPLSDEQRRTYDNLANEQRFLLMQKLETAAQVTQESLRYFERQPVTAIPVTAFSSLEQLTECVGAFE